MTRRLLRVLLLVAVPAAAQTPPPVFPPAPQFEIDRLRVPGKLISVHAEDLDGDGKRDLVAIFTQGAPGQIRRKIGLFYHRGAFRPELDQVLEPPAGASFVDVADVAGDARREILFGDAQGLSYLSPGPKGYGAANPLFAITGLVLVPDEEDLPFLDVARDWDGDGKEEILLPLPDRVALIARDGSEPPTWQKRVDLMLPPRVTYAVRGDVHEPRARNYWLRAVITVPELYRGDFDGDGRSDLIAVIDDTVTVFKSDPATIFAATPTAQVKLAARTEAEAARGNATVQITVRDLDGDGVADLAVNKVSGGMGTMRGQTAIYLGKKGGGYGRPAQLLTREGFAGALLFGDLDGDGRPEMVECHNGASFGEIVRIVLSKRIALNFAIRRNLGAKGFSTVPEGDRPIDFTVDYSAGAELEGSFPSLEGDFNGDGKRDLAGPKGDGALGIWLGGGKTLLDEYPKAIVHLPLSRYWMVTDLDGDRRADVVFYHRFRGDMQGQIAVLRNTGRGW
ncbi:MAG: VCBS repeat-containing protein [Myxococcales bacterium]|nr:VCBS repeat-containing protein [Myxococcales bacterium]